MTQTKTLNTYTFFEEAKNAISNLTFERKELLLNIANCITEEYKEREKLNLNFICTHNSRRSQIAQIWSFFAAEYFNIENIYSYSGGTEVTAFHRNTVRSLQHVGFEFNVIDFSHQNPKYLITFNKTKKSILGYSKVFDDQENKYPYIAITTCDSADENCPFIPDAIERFHLPFTDPKHADNTDLTSETYLQTNKEIACELYFIFDEVKRQLDS